MEGSSLLISRLEAACLLGVSVRTIDRLCDGGKLSRMKIGRRALVLRTSIDEYLSASVAQPPVVEVPRPRFALPELEQLKRRRADAQRRRAA